MKVYYIDWDNESGDRGVIGAFKNRPTDEQVAEFMRKHFPDDFDGEDAFIYYTVDEFFVSDDISNIIGMD